MGRKGLLAIVLLSLFIAFILKFFWPTPHDEHLFLPVEKPVVKARKAFMPPTKGCLTQTAAIIWHLILVTRMLTIGQTATPVISLWFTGIVFQRAAMP